MAFSDYTTDVTALMQVVEGFLDGQYQKKRLTGNEYTQAYIQLLQSVLGIAGDIRVKEKQIESISKDIDLKDKQIQIADKDIDLKTERVFNEQAKRLDTVNGAPVSGLIGKQKTLYQRQADGFLRDAEQKAAKILADSWQVRRSTDPNATPVSGTGMENSNISIAISKLMDGAGM